jgi:hypothetical protein
MVKDGTEAEDIRGYAGGSEVAAREVFITHSPMKTARRLG